MHQSFFFFPRRANRPLYSYAFLTSRRGVVQEVVRGGGSSLHPGQILPGYERRGEARGEGACLLGNAAK